MRNYLIRLSLRLMLWNSNRLRRKVNRLADKLTKACIEQEAINNAILRIEQQIRALS